MYTLKLDFIFSSKDTTWSPGGPAPKDPVLSPPWQKFDSRAENQPSHWVAVSAGPKPD